MELLGRDGKARFRSTALGAALLKISRALRRGLRITFVLTSVLGSRLQAISR